MKTQWHHLTRLENLTNTLFSAGKYTKAIDTAKELLEMAKETEDQKAMMNAHIHLSSCYYFLGDIETAFQHILEYKLLCNEFGDDRDKYHLYRLSALIYEYEENYEEAKEAMRQCIQIAEELEMYSEAGTSYNTYSNYLLQEGKYGEALDYASKALHICAEHCPSEILLQCHIYLTIASCHIGMNELTKAEEIIDHLALNQYINHFPHEKAHFLHVKASFHRSKGEHDQALQFLNDSFKIYSDFKNQIKLKSILKEIAEIHESRGDYKKAYEALKEYIQMAEKLFSIRLSYKMREFDVHQSIKAIEKRANVDSLTGVYNRYFLETTCNKWLKEAKKEGQHICFVIIDIDSFKHINDTYGHLLGDEVIKQVAQACLKVAYEDKENILVGRYGGDEFIVLFRNCPPHSIMDKAKQLYNEITSIQINHASHDIHLTVSIGAVCTNSLPYAKKFTQLLKVADHALYMAKRQGKNQIVYLSNENC
ncbi:tetratricopeptide repeat-containing diguanylate cyclase [Ureibacillus terrenus]|uniref:Diguanylate cyclase n=1 Tax=Ureibacillus terrenus TaxID=118246 RepID=A0A540V5K0_9BACL|nr:tetratricopeptide repeat-containing diguanylate cyclase [Ureibacillus terrenus]MED3661245.1 diguanylate cyclase [Ureibacillus terrenus]MED3764280.1 diguanylate cyclase [Ureibacillus terrenus]TQE92034.1 diguanylate cyclase [Ureibacillus terrenus]